MDTVITVLHVVGAVFIVGPMAILPQTALRSLRAGHGDQVITLARSTLIFSLLSLLVVVFGFGALGMSDPKYHVSLASTWIWLSIVLYVVALAISLFLVVPAMRRAGEAARSSAAVASSAAAAPSPVAADGTAGSAGGYGAIAGGSGVASLLLLAVVVLMVWKP